MLPIAVYGTLRPGGGADYLWKGMQTRIDHGTVPGYRLVTHGPYPFALADPTDRIVVDVLTFDWDTFDRVLARLDRLEGHPSFYARRIVTATLDDGERVDCWLYVPVNERDYVGLTPVPGNDWTAR